MTRDVESVLETEINREDLIDFILEDFSTADAIIIANEDRKSIFDD